MSRGSTRPEGGPGLRLFRLAARLLPASLREEWRDDLEDAFLRRQEEFRERWPAVLVPLVWVPELAGLLRAAVAVRRLDPWTRRTQPGGDDPGPHQEARPRWQGRLSREDRIMDSLLSDLRFSLRALTRRPATTALAICSLALGIGASTAMFSVVDSVLVRPLPFPEPGEMVAVYPTLPELSGTPQVLGTFERGTFSQPELFWVEEHQQAFDAFGGYISWGGPAWSGGDGPPARLRRVMATPGLLPALGVEPLRGRLLGPEDDPSAGGRAVLLTEPFWRSAFGADPDVIGETMRLDDVPHTIVGILPGRVREATTRADIWTLMPGEAAHGNWGDHGVSGTVGRLRDGVSLEQAREEVARLLAEVPPEGEHGHGASAFPLLQDQTRNARPALLALIAGAFILLAVGCANVALLLLGTGVDRRQELAVRGALGAGRGRLTRQLLTESLVLAGAGAVGGVLLAVVLGQGLLLLAPENLPRVDAVSLDLRALTFGIVVSLAAGLLFGMAPALGLSRPDVTGPLRGSRGSTRGGQRAQNALVVGEIALATVLLVAAALLGRTLLALESAELGLAPEGLYAVQLDPPYHRIQDEDDDTRRAAFDAYFQRFVDSIGSLPGVAGVAVTNVAPLVGGGANNYVVPEGWDPEAEGEQLLAGRRQVSDGFFEVAGIPIVEGRGLLPFDNRPDAAPVMVISEGLARRVWPGESALGKRIAYWARDPIPVVGVAADVRDRRLAEPTVYAIYVAARQASVQTGDLLVRLEPGAGAAAAVPALRERIWDVDPDVPVTLVASYEEIVSERVGDQRYRARLMAVFAGLAAAFAMMGVYGVTARAVARRSRELGIRMALGAEARNVMAMVLRQGARLAVPGVIVGAAVSLVATRWIESLLYGVDPTDPVTLAGIALAVGVGSLAATLPPSRRATRVDPIVALRAE